MFDCGDEDDKFKAVYRGQNYAKHICALQPMAHRPNMYLVTIAVLMGTPKRASR